MRKLILEIQTSLDGFIAREDGSTDWMNWNWGPDWTWAKELQQHHMQLTDSADCFLLSRQMAAEGFNAHWRAVTENPDDPRFTFAKHVTDSRKVVFTSTLDKSTDIPGGWKNTDIAQGDFVSAIRNLKQEVGKNIMVFGGATFVSSLIKARLIDEFHLLVNPVALGRGMPIFTSETALTLVRSQSFSCGMNLLHCKPINP